MKGVEEQNRKSMMKKVLVCKNMEKPTQKVPNQWMMKKDSSPADKEGVAKEEEEEEEKQQGV